MSSSKNTATYQMILLITTTSTVSVAVIVVIIVIVTCVTVHLRKKRIQSQHHDIGGQSVRYYKLNN